MNIFEIVKKIEVIIFNADGILSLIDGLWKLYKQQKLPSVPVVPSGDKSSGVQ